MTGPVFQSLAELFKDFAPYFLNAPSVDLWVGDLSDDHMNRVAARSGVATPLAGSTYAEDIAVDMAGNAYVAESGHIGLLKLPAGGGQPEFLAPGLVQQDGVAADWSGNIYFSGKTYDSGSNYKAFKIPVGGGAPQEIWSATNRPYAAMDVGVDRPGNVYIFQWNPAGVVKLPAGGGQQTYTPIPEVAEALGFTVDPKGQYFYIADAKGNRVLKVPTKGGPATTVGTGTIDAYDVAVDNAGNIYVADCQNNRVVQVPPTGHQTTVFRTKWPLHVAVKPTRLFSGSDRIHDTLPHLDLDDLMATLLGAADRDGGGWVVIGDHFIPIPPRSPVLSFIGDAIRPHMDRRVQDAELAERLRALKGRGPQSPS